VQMGGEAYHGLAGEIVTRLREHTEADDAALLVSCLVGLGSMLGGGPHARVGATRHGLKRNPIPCVPVSPRPRRHRPSGSLRRRERGMRKSACRLRLHSRQSLYRRVKSRLSTGRLWGSSWVLPGARL